MEKKNHLSELMSVTMEHVRAMADANTIIGTPIQADGVTLIPVSRLSFGIAGGRDRVFYQKAASQRSGLRWGQRSQC